MLPFRRTRLLLLAGLLAAVCASAQEPTAELRVALRDSAGNALPGRVDLRGPVCREASTDARGALALGGLPPGRYRLTFAAPGFAPRTVSVLLRTGASSVQEMRLAVAGEPGSITVAAPIPVGPAGTPLAELPVPASGLSTRALVREHLRDLPDALAKQTPGVYLNGNAGNPFQADVNYHGYTASPLLGTPQGLSVYLDGVRQNQPFGDVVAWDLIPHNAIRSVVLIPGADSLYGLNSLGGALAVETKDGASEPGLSAETVGGSFGRRSVEGEYGGGHGPFDWYAAGNAFHEDGWRQDSPSRLRQSFAHLRFGRAGTTVSLGGLYAIDSLAGNGLQDFRALARGYANVYSRPDTTRNQAPALTLSAARALGPRWLLSATAYARHLRSDTANGDLNTDSYTEDVYDLSSADAASLTAAGYSGFPLTGDARTEPFPFWRCLAQSLQNADPGLTCTGVLTEARTRENNYGVSGALARQRGRLAVGAGWDRGSLSYAQDSQWGYLGGDGRTILPVPTFAGNAVALHGEATTASVYASDAWQLGAWLVTAAARYNRTAVRNADRLPATATRGSLDGNDVFERLNPAAGAVYRRRLPFDIYANYSESSRAPTSIELGCSDPALPCNLPNALVSDPPLRQVVARTVEAGARSRADGALLWSAGWFWGQNAHDLLFVASPQLGFGYFLNFGATRRAGAEATLRWEGRRALLSGSYTFLRATYRSAQVLPGAANSSADGNGTLTIAPGDHIPQTPEHVFKALAEYRTGVRWTLDLDVLAVGASFARGNENNLDRPDGETFLGAGSSPAYAVTDAGAEYRVSPRFRLFLQANNLFDRRYSTGAQLGSTPFDSVGGFVAGRDVPRRSTTFLAPGAPLDLYGGLRVRLP